MEHRGKCSSCQKVSDHREAESKRMKITIRGEGVIGEGSETFEMSKNKVVEDLLIRLVSGCKRNLDHDLLRVRRGMFSS